MNAIKKIGDEKQRFSECESFNTDKTNKNK